MQRFLRSLEENQKDLARLVSEEHGKTVADAMGSVQRGMEVVEFACGIPHLLKGEHSENVGTQVDTHTCASRSASAPASRRSTSR
jgi:malonate-semialdehyde dehydrogenase (acetylating)/methylmalonate-semialdehyde dehydrogenase